MEKKIGNVYKELKSASLLSLYQNKSLKNHHILEKMKRNWHSCDNRFIFYDSVSCNRHREAASSSIWVEYQKEKAYAWKSGLFWRRIGGEATFEKYDWKVKWNQLYQIFQEILRDAQIDRSEAEKSNRISCSLGTYILCANYRSVFL